MSPWDRHAAYRELLARRLDAELSAAETSDLDVHLASCPACRTVAAEYVEQRHLSDRCPPTSRRATCGHARRPPSTTRWPMACAIPAGSPSACSPAWAHCSPWPPPRAASCRSASRAGRRDALRGHAATGGLHHAPGRRADHLPDTGQRALPDARLDCTSGGADTTPLLRVDTNVDPSDLALGTDGSLVITGRDQPATPSTRCSSCPMHPRRPPRPARPRPPRTPRARDHAAGTPSASARTASPRPTPSSGASAPAGTSPAATTDITPPPSPSEAPTPVPGHTRAILSNVIAAGAPAAWSPDGKVLAFSAMPADGSQGPDIYMWRPGEPAARPLTKDHRSWFASWVGARILPSHTARAVDPSGGHARRKAGHVPLPALDVR